MHNSQPRKPGELAFAAFLVIASLYLLYTAYGISGFEALSAPGSVPMATTFTMVVTSLIVVFQTLRQPPSKNETFARDVFPFRIALIALMLIAYAFALKPIGFLPTSAVFLILAIKFLSHRSWAFSIAIGLFSLIVIYLIFRIVFTVLIPAGIVPEGEMLAWVRNLFSEGQ